jgi:hypothetical protein
MIINFSPPDAWLMHLKERVRTARELGLLNTLDEVELQQNITCFLPDGFAEKTLKNIDPTCSLRELMSDERSHKSGWLERSDLFDEASSWLKNEYGNDSRVLLCEAGFSKVGDKVLESRPHIILKGEPILYLRLRDADASHIARLLRWARSLRVLGVVAELKNNNFEEGFFRVLFMCDIFDGDSLVFCPTTCTPQEIAGD